MTERASALRAPASFPGLEQITRFVLGLVRRASLPDQAGYRLRLAVDELATNTVTHGYRDGGGEITVYGGVEPDRVWIRLEDQADCFDPRTRLHPPDPATPLQDRPIGGLGIYLALTSLDEFDYAYVCGRNVLTLTVRR
ncbi:ATP-binding protein [Streptacidiphilus sp. N1-12]|uniref:ATP-binding protein n=2 Tax=Streptacidiphilus alkalitolerans TaxID=3342712 RepID=A0ABV6V3K9_9ACTN